MKPLSIAIARRDAVQTVRALRDAMNDGTVTMREAEAALCPAERVEQRVIYLHEVEAHGHALAREATSPDYLDQMHERLKRAAANLPLDAA